MNANKPERQLLKTILLTSLLLSNAPGYAKAEDGDCTAIGVATIDAAGVIVLRLIARGAEGMTGEGTLRYAPSDPYYRDVAAHIGPLRPGQTVAVCPWPDDIPDAPH